MKCVKGEPDFSFLNIEKLRECERALQNVIFAFERCDDVSSEALKSMEMMRKACADEVMNRVSKIPGRPKPEVVSKAVRKIPLKRSHLTRK